MNGGTLSAVVLFAAATLSGCASLSRPTQGAERISFQPQPAPFCGRCESTNLVVTADGQLHIEVGHWGGHYRNWKRERSIRQITLAQFEDFKRRLEAYRPAEDTLRGDAACVNYITDQDGVLVEWSNGEERQTRVFDFGCLDDPAMNEAVRTAPSALGL